MMKRMTFAPLAALLAVAPLAASAQTVSSERAAMLGQLDDAAGKLTQLAGAIGQDKYGWRPGAGVRSVSELLMHVTGGNYYVLGFAGVQPTKQLPQNAETAVTDKAQVAAALKESFDHARNAIRNLADADMDKAVTMFGQPSTVRNVYFVVVTHAHEHLGQLIAYARSNGVVPPWSN
jgi:uncharacterized damage-inducible protein DinB